jgi:hypothetical protein
MARKTSARSASASARARIQRPSDRRQLIQIMASTVRTRASACSAAIALRGRPSIHAPSGSRAIAPTRAPISMHQSEKRPARR